MTPNEIAAAADRKSSENPELKKAMGKLWASIAAQSRAITEDVLDAARAAGSDDAEFGRKVREILEAYGR